MYTYSVYIHTHIHACIHIVLWENDDVREYSRTVLCININILFNMLVSYFSDNALTDTIQWNGFMKLTDCIDKPQQMCFESIWQEFTFSLFACGLWPMACLAFCWFRCPLRAEILVQSDGEIMRNNRTTDKIKNVFFTLRLTGRLLICAGFGADKYSSKRRFTRALFRLDRSFAFI